MQLVWVLQKTTIATQVVITRDPGGCFFYESYKLKLQVAIAASAVWNEFPNLRCDSRNLFHFLLFHPAAHL